jgi:predicted DNA-binding transcriptional regulator YafY
MRASRLLSILMLLQMRGRTSAEALAKEFDVSLRTIYRDIDQLSAAGVPVYAERGRDGGFALLDGYRTRLTGLTDKEAVALPLAALGRAASDLGLGPEGAAAQLKLLAALPADKSATAARVAARFHFDAEPWYRRAEKVALLPDLAGAVWREKKIRFAYESWKGAVTREADPLGLAIKGGHWYLVAAREGAPLVYRVSKIHALRVLETKAARPARFDLARFWSGWAGDFEARLLTGRARMRLSPKGVRLLSEVSAAAAEAAAGGAPDREGWITADIPVEKTEVAALQLLRLGAEFEVLAPASLRAAVAAEAKKIAALNRHEIGKRR